MSKLITLLLICFSVSAFSQTQSLAESVEYDPIQNRFISGNDAVSMIQQDTMGNLSYFGASLPSNLGMEIIGNNIFCIVATSQTDPIRIVNVYDLSTEMFITSYTINDASFLNGMTSDGVSKIWVTDFQGQSIYEIDFSNLMCPSSQQIVGSQDVGTQPNGITYDASQNRLVFVSWSDSNIRQVDLLDYSVSLVLENAGISNMDGIDMDNDNNFYISSWTPTSRVTKFSNDFLISENLNIPQLSNPADLCVAKEIGMLAIPSFQHDVILWRLEDSITSTTDKLKFSDVSLSTFPNPSNGFFNVDLKGISWVDVKCQIISPNGQLLKSVSFVNDGSNQFKLDLSQQEEGAYIMSLTIDEYHTISKLIHVVSN